jgi:hypothetical protein
MRMTAAATTTAKSWDESRVPLTPRERGRIAEIHRFERSYGC